MRARVRTERPSRRTSSGTDRSGKRARNSGSLTGMRKSPPWSSTVRVILGWTAASDSKMAARSTTPFAASAVNETKPSPVSIRPPSLTWVVTIQGRSRRAAGTGSSSMVRRFIVSRQMPRYSPGVAPHMSKSRRSSNEVNSKWVSMASTTPKSLSIGLCSRRAAAIRRRNSSVDGDSFFQRISPPEQDRTVDEPRWNACSAALRFAAKMSFALPVSRWSGMCSAPPHSM